VAAEGEEEEVMAGSVPAEVKAEVFPLSGEMKGEVKEISREEPIALGAAEEGDAEEWTQEEEEEEKDDDAAAGPAPEEYLEGAGEEVVSAGAPEAEGDAAAEGVEIDWVREVLSQGEEAEEEEVPAAAEEARSEKSDLSPKERERLEPVGLFIMDLVKAMARSSYYDPNHPGAKSAKQGLYQEFKDAIQDSREIMITYMQARERSDLLVSGVLEDQVSVRTVVGTGMAELFIPKLKDYFERKGLLSIALKHDMPEESFSWFVDIMSDPKADRGVDSQVGAILTKALAEHGITEVSAVFVDDVVMLEERVSWRVQMAINRLAKDIKTLPMFKGLGEREIHRMKVRIVQDIIRPLRQPALLKDIVINCYVIVKHVKDLTEEELESTVIDSFPFSMLMSTSKLLFEDMTSLKEKLKENPGNTAIMRRLRGATRIIKTIALRVIREEAPGAREFLEQLYFNEILAFHELPPAVQYRVNTYRLTDDVKARLHSYAHETETVATADDMRTLIQCFQRVFPMMIEKNDWGELLTLCRALDRAGRENPVVRQGPQDIADPLHKALDQFQDDLVAASEHGQELDQEAYEEIMTLLGPVGIEALFKILALSEHRSARKVAVDTLVKIGAPALEKVRKILDDPGQYWYLHRNALLILGRIGAGEDDAKRVRRFLRHSHPRLREEALTTIIRFEGAAAEPVLIAALGDADKRIQRRALSGLGQIQPLSEAGLNAIMARLKEEPPKDREEAKNHEDRLAQIIRALSMMSEFADPAGLENTLLAVAELRWKKKSALLTRLRGKIEVQEEPVVLLASLDALGKVAGPGAQGFLEKVSKEVSPVGAKAKEALNRLQLRLGVG
jgi:hypothetical protein